MSRTTLSSETYILLHDMAMKKLADEYGDTITQRSVESLYGFGSKRSPFQEASLAWALGRNDKAIEHINGKHYYLKYKEAQKREKVVLPNFYLYPLLHYVGFSNLVEFQNSPGVKEELEGKSVYFTGFYFSLADHDVKTFSLRINFTKNGNPCRIEGLTDSFGDGDVFVGKVVSKGRYFYANLESKDGDNERFINLSCSFPGFGKMEELARAEYVQGVLSGYFNVGGLVSHQVIFVNKAYEMEPENFANIRRFLTLKRHQYRVRYSDAPMISLGEHDLRDVDELPGAYKIWNLRANGRDLAQSILKINEDLRAQIQLPVRGHSPHYENQICTVNLYKQTDQLLITRYLKGQPTGYAVFYRYDWIKSKVIHGVASWSDGSRLMTGHIVVKRIEVSDKSEAIPKVLSKKEAIIADPEMFAALAKYSKTPDISED